MNITVQTADFVRELELLAKVVLTKPTIPVLANVLLEANGNGIRLATTDLEIGLVTFCPALIEMSGSTTLPVKHLLDVTKLLSGNVILTLDKTTARLTSGQYKSRLQTFQAQEYPALPSMKDLPTITLSGLQEAIRRVKFAVSDKDKRYFLNGALLSFTPQGFTLAATDGHRLAYVQVATQTWEHEPVIISSKTLDKLLEMPGDVMMAVGVRHTFFVVEGRLLFSCHVAGTFPNYTRIIPKDPTYEVVCNRQLLKDTIQRIILTAEEVLFSLTPGVMTLTAKSPEIGDAVEHLDVQYDGPPVSMTLKGSYLLDFLAVATGVNLQMSWKDSGAVLFVDSADYCYVQMPLRSV